MRNHAFRSILLACGAIFGISTLVSAAPGHLGAAAPACIAPATWAAPEASGIRATPGPATLASMALRDVVLLGEQHDNADHHRWQLQTLAALHGRRPDMVIGFEMFPRRLQPVLDQWVAGKLSEKRFLELSSWDTIWKMPAELYMPLFQFARLNRIPMVALNVEPKLIRDTSDGGWASVPESEREGVGQAAAALPAYVDELFEVHQAHAEMRRQMRGHDDGSSPVTADRNDPAFRHFVEAQQVWDRAMAEALARRSRATTKDGSKPLVVGIMGGGHIRGGHGVPYQLRDLGIDSIGTLLPIAASTPCADIPAGLANAVFAVPGQTQDAPPPPRLGVALEVHGEGLRVASVTPASLAERSGILAGDIIIEAAGVQKPTAGSLIASIRAQPSGTWLPMKIKRGDETLELVVRFPAKS
jgi:uncharacterized iron-regulated protein